ncbi:hypothetical protein UlMin_007806 [Ulmus minor]
MAELVGSALLSAFFNVLFDRLATEEVKNFLRPKKVVKKLLEKLEFSLLSADELLDDAEEKLIYSPRVEKWHNKLKDVVYRATELADQIETEALRQDLEGHQSASSFDNYVRDELEEILSSLEHLLSLKDALGLEPAGKSNSSGVTTRDPVRFRPTPVADESGFCGREDIKETIIQSLRSADVCGDVIPIIGAGGLGKTTLAQVVYNHPDVKLQFGEHRAWVTVSTEFDLLAIAKKIIGQVSNSSQIDGTVDEQVILFKLNEALKGKKFLLVLDDVWSENRDEWNNLKSCFKAGERGSKIIVTTRSTTVASIAAPSQPHHFLPELSQEDCWRLFAKTVFPGDQDWDAHPDLQEIGKKIVKKCRGLPLSVISVGGILCGDRDPEKWRSILKSSVWELLQQNSKNIIPSLWLSYRYLPSHLKRCFAYCSIFPKDRSLVKEEIVRLWMAEGFLKDVAGSTMEEVGKQYFEDLISRSLFQRSSYDEETIMMHDLVHDLAMYVSGKFCFMLDKDKNSRDLACETRHLSYNLAIGDAKKFEGLSKPKRLHSFVRVGRSFYGSGDGENLEVLKVLEGFLMEGACLRVLSLSPSYKIDSLLDSVGKLKHLRYLNLSYTSVTKLPDSIGTLYNLQTLLLVFCRNLTRLPSNLVRLINLHHLDTRGSPLEEMPPHMCNLTKLQTLTDFVVGKHGSSIRDLVALHDLHGQLRISGLQNVDDVLKGNMEDKENLRKLVLVWEGQTDDSRKEKMVLDALQPHANLKELFISNYGGTSFPDWVGHSLFSKIETVRLDGCRNCLFLPSLGSLASLNRLTMKGFHGLETIADEFCASDSPFKALEYLHFEDMPEWKRWSVIEVPRLKELRLHICPKLVGSLPNSNTITLLEIVGCESLDFPENHLYPSLERLKIVRSCGSIKRLSLEHLPKLKVLELEELECLVELTGESPDELKMLSIKKCPKLEFPGNSRYASLEYLKIEKCEDLKSIPLDYFPKLERFFLLRCEFDSFRFGEESPLVLESLNFYIEECEILRSLPQQMHLPSLNRLDVRNCREIELWPEGGLPSNLKTLVIWECKRLNSQVMHWDLQTLLPCLESFCIKGCGEELLDSFPPEGLLPTSLTFLYIGDFRGLKTLNIHAFQHLKQLLVYDCDELQCLPEESLPNSLAELYINNCPLLERRYQKETGGGWHKISHIPRVWINLIEQHMS